MHSERSSGVQRDAMTTYVPAVEQLVVEVFVRDASRSKVFYEQLGFHVAEDRGTFVVLTWEGHELFLDQRGDLPDPRPTPQANLRVMVPDVDAYWRRARDRVRSWSATSTKPSASQACAKRGISACV